MKSLINFIFIPGIILWQPGCSLEFLKKNSAAQPLLFPPKIEVLGESYIFSYNGSEQNLVELRIRDIDGIMEISINGKKTAMGGVVERLFSVPALPGKEIKVWAEDMKGARSLEMIYKAQGSDYFRKKYLIEEKFNEK
jgi:hypothetical protein